ncbi:methyltransferase-like protein 25B isoform X1 [Tachypleus tridentatus]|uniref:methyltransferase-like protein 25B isoform X1 n=1 Tax=Tachypleus tridentatus TaxID=6853 RepID=UPI003FD36EDB
MAQDEVISDDLKIYETVRLLAEYSWVYNFCVTKIFTSNVLENIPYEWKAHLQDLRFEEMNKVPFGFIKSDWPQSLQSFVKTCLTMAEARFMTHRVNINPSVNVTIPPSIQRGMAPKKIHEVNQLAELLGIICKEVCCNRVVDVGSGLGYLGQVLHNNFGIQVIGIEREKALCLSAKERSLKGECSSNMHHITMKLTDNKEEFGKLLGNLPPQVDCECRRKSFSKLSDDSNGVVLCGLHCCGDLGPNLMKEFLQHRQIIAVICVGCCYHLMSSDESSGKSCFKNFPLSQKYKKIFQIAKKHHPDWEPSQYGLRLGAQETRARWFNETEEDHHGHTKHLAYRAILEAFIENEGIVWKKKRRRVARKNQFSTFRDYAFAIADGFSCSDQERQLLVEKLVLSYDLYSSKFPLVEAFTMFQVLFQPLWEWLVVHDRVCFLEESGVAVFVQPVFDEAISPRNLAIIAKKKVS